MEEEGKGNKRPLCVLSAFSLFRKLPVLEITAGSSGCEMTWKFLSHLPSVLLL